MAPSTGTPCSQGDASLRLATTSFRPASWRIAELADDTLQAYGAGLLVNELRLRLEMLAQLDAVGLASGSRGCEEALALDERRLKAESRTRAGGACGSRVRATAGLVGRAFLLLLEASAFSPMRPTCLVLGSAP